MGGFGFYETMAGAFRLRGEARDRPMSFTIGARSRSWGSFLRRREVVIEGAIDAEGFADHRHLVGTLGLDPIVTRRLPYAFRFTANDGTECAFAGEKTIHPAHLLTSMTVLPGAILDASGPTLADALLRFDARGDLGRFLKSFRLAR
jgi:hypothetical protein